MRVCPSCGIEGVSPGGDAAVLALADRQHGVATTAQLVGAGLGRRGIANRVQRGWLVPLFRGVYRVGPIAAPRSGDGGDPRPARAPP